jgi:hypothetical protein
MNGNNSKQQDEEVKYPYLVVCQISGFYARAQIVFVPDTTVKPARKALTLVFPQPFVEGRLTDRCKEVLIEVVKHEVRRTQYRMCIVFGEADCIFVEPDGATRFSDEPPTFEIQLPNGEWVGIKLPPLEGLRISRDEHDV